MCKLIKNNKYVQIYNIHTLNTVYDMTTLFLEMHPDAYLESWMILGVSIESYVQTRVQYVQHIHALN